MRGKGDFARLTGLAALLLGLGLGAAAQAPAPAGQTPAAPYQDRLMQGQGQNATADDNEAVPEYDSSGLPRAYSLESIADQRVSQGQTSSSLGLKASGYADTANYGTFSGNINLQQRSMAQDPDASFVVRQIGMPFDGGWRLDNALGMINLPLLDLARGSERISMGAPSMLGLNSQLHQGGLDMTLAAGRSGQVQGYPVAGFRLSQGSYSLLSAQRKDFAANGLWSWGGMLAQAADVSSVLAQTPTGQGRMEAQGVYLGSRREWLNPDAPSEPGFIQVNALSGSNTGTDITGLPNSPATGLWIEGGLASGPHRNSWGLFRLDPGLAWLDLPMASDLQGGYWRYAWRTRQWFVEAGLELLTSLTGITPNGSFSNASVRYQYSSATSFGANASVRRYGIGAQSLQLYSQFASGLGSSRAQLELSSADSGEQLTRLQFDHDWTAIEALRLSTALSVDRDVRPAGQTQGLGLAVSTDWSIGRSTTLNQSLQGRWSTDQTQYTLNAGLTWRFAPQWSLQANVYAIQGSSNASSLAQSPLTVLPLPIATTNDSGIFVLLRFDESAGRANAPLGGRPGSAAGGLTGSVFLDENQNGKRDASERGAPNVTVLLDGRYAVETDAQGRFEFAYVTAGAHVLSVISDNLPLPWSLVKDGRTEVKIFTRDTTTVDIPALRQ